MNVRRQGYYEWAARERERPARFRQDEVLTAKIQNIFYESKRRATKKMRDAPTVKSDMICDYEQVWLLHRQYGICGAIGDAVHPLRMQSLHPNTPAQ
jgi:hypothetical protein